MQTATSKPINIVNNPNRTYFSKFKNLQQLINNIHIDSICVKAINKDKKTQKILYYTCELGYHPCSTTDNINREDLIQLIRVEAVKNARVATYNNNGKVCYRVIIDKNNTNSEFNKKVVTRYITEETKAPNLNVPCTEKEEIIHSTLGHFLNKQGSVMNLDRLVMIDVEQIVPFWFGDKFKQGKYEDKSAYWWENKNRKGWVIHARNFIDALSALNNNKRETRVSNGLIMKSFNTRGVVDYYITITKNILHSYQKIQRQLKEPGLKISDEYREDCIKVLHNMEDYMDIINKLYQNMGVLI